VPYPHDLLDRPFVRPKPVICPHNATEFPKLRKTGQHVRILHLSGQGIQQRCDFLKVQGDARNDHSISRLFAGHDKVYEFSVHPCIEKRQ
jgi:hypothetical protein